MDRIAYPLRDATGKALDHGIFKYRIKRDFEPGDFVHVLWGRFMPTEEKNVVPVYQRDYGFLPMRVVAKRAEKMYLVGPLLGSGKKACIVPEEFLMWVPENISPEKEKEKTPSLHTVGC